MQQPPTPNPGVEPPVPIQPTLATSEPTYRHQIRITFPDLAKLAQAGRYAELALACDNLEAAIPDDPDSCRLLLTGPLVLAHLINDDATSAYFALKRLPGPLATTALPQALLPLTASIADRKYQNIQPRISTLISLAQNPQALEPELALLVESMAGALQVAWRKRIVALLSRAYASIPAAQASALLNLPAEKIASEVSSWRYDSASATFTPLGDAVATSARAPSSLTRFDDVVAGAAQLEKMIAPRFEISFHPESYLHRAFSYLWNPKILKSDRVSFADKPDCENDKQSASAQSATTYSFTSSSTLMAQLTEGAINRFLYAVETQTEDNLFGWEPVLQILIIKEIAGNKPGDPPRKRLILSDGNHFVQAMLATQRNNLVDEEQIVRFSVIKLTKFHASMLAGKRLIILIDLEVVEREAEKIGEPKNIESSGVVPPPEPTLKPTPMASTSSSVGPGPTLVNQQKGRSAISKPSNSYPIYPIEQLSPYQNKWTIKARVTQKSDIRNFSTARGEGKLFNVTLTDETGEIRGTAFNTAVDELFDKFQEGKVYFISKARVNIAKKKFGGSTNDFELGLERHTEVEECTDTSNVPEVRYNFVELGKLDQTEKDAIIDVLGVVSQVGDLTELTSKAGKMLTKRDLTLVDRSQYSVRMTLWGKQAEAFNASNNPVMAFKAVKVGDFGGRTLSMVGTSTYQENPDISEAHLLRGWYDSEGQGASFNSQTAAGGGSGSAQFRRDELMTLSTVKDSGIGQGDNADYFSCRATIIFVKPDTVMYAACPSDKCNKKVTEEPSGDYRCEKCDRNYPEPDYRYLMTVHVADHTNQLWLQAFNDVGQSILGMTAKQLFGIEREDPSAAQAIIQRAHSQIFNFNCRAKADTYNDQTRIRYGINRVWPLDYATEGRAILDTLKAY